MSGKLEKLCECTCKADVIWLEMWTGRCFRQNHLFYWDKWGKQVAEMRTGLGKNTWIGERVFVGD